MIRKYVLYILTAIASLPLHAALEWNTRAVLADAKPTDSYVDVAYTFKNTGDAPVTITEVKGTCSCLAMNDVKGTYAKDQGATIKVRYNFGSKAGTTVEHIQIKTAENDKPESLRLTVNIPVFFQFNPQTVFWMRGEQPEPKEVYFYDLTNGKSKIVQVYSTDTNITATLQPETTPGQRAILLTPAALDQAGGSIIYVDVDIGQGVIRKTKIIAAIHDPSEIKAGRSKIIIKN